LLFGLFFTVGTFLNRPLPAGIESQYFDIDI
jgi:hypothetical protein